MRIISKLYIALVIFFLYAPLAVMVVFSFNSSNSTAVFEDFSFRWYTELFKNSAVLNALGNTLLLAFLSALIATVLGSAAAVGIFSYRKKWKKSLMMSVTNVPMMNPDIVTGMSMMLFFVAVAGILGISYNNMGFAAMLIAHTTFCLPYVILSVLPRINELGNSLSEAALDLGCTPLQSFFKVELPNIMPGVLTGFIMAFTLSLDDFVISYFVGSSNFQTLPLLIYSMTKKKVTPDMYALSTLIIVTIFILLIVSNVRSAKEEERKRRRAAKK